MMTKTSPELFIIESLEIVDEKAQRQEGDIISRMLSLSGKTATEYYYIRTCRELRKMIDMFGTSNNRYLHISCHADPVGIATTFDTLNNSELSVMLRDHLRNRRLFVSAWRDG